MTYNVFLLYTKNITCIRIYVQIYQKMINNIDIHLNYFIF